MLFSIILTLTVQLIVDLWFRLNLICQAITIPLSIELNIVYVYSDSIA